MRPTKLKVFQYLRKSRKDIEQEQHDPTYDTLGRHRQTLQDIIKREQHDLIGVYEEVATGESISERPKMLEMLRAVEAGGADAVICMDLDRLGRGDMLDQGIIDRAFRYSGTLIITPTEVYDPEDEGWELIFGIKSLVARGELKAITKRLQNGRKASIREGKSISKNPPYGYLRDENLKLYPNPETQQIVRMIFEMVANGHGRQSVAMELERLGVAPPNPNRDTWSPSMISHIIKNEVYKGDLVWGKVKYAKRHGKYTRRKTSPNEWIVSKNAHEAIVSEELWNKANEAHSGRHRAPSVNLDRKLSNPLAGIIKCELCGYSMVSQPRKDRRAPMLKCSNITCKEQKMSYLDIVERKVIDNLHELVNHLEITSKLEKPDNNIVDIKEKLIVKKENELQIVQEQLDNLHDLLERKVYDEETFFKRQSILLEKIKTIEEEIKMLKDEIAQSQMQLKQSKEYIPAVKKVIEAYHYTDDIEKKNALLKSVLHKVTYLRKKAWTKQDQFELHLYPKI